MQFTIHYFDLVSKKLFASRCKSNNQLKINIKCGENES